MIFKPFHYFETGCAAYVFGCGSLGKCAIVDPQEQDVEADGAVSGWNGTENGWRHAVQVGRDDSIPGAGL